VDEDAGQEELDQYGGRVSKGEFECLHTRGVMDKITASENNPKENHRNKGAEYKSWINPQGPIFTKPPNVWIFEDRFSDQISAHYEEYIDCSPANTLAIKYFIFVVVTHRMRQAVGVANDYKTGGDKAQNIEIVGMPGVFARFPLRDITPPPDSAMPKDPRYSLWSSHRNLTTSTQYTWRHCPGTASKSTIRFVMPKG
jgi:hypothetical protein